MRNLTLISIVFLITSIVSSLKAQTKLTAAQVSSALNSNTTINRTISTSNNTTIVQNETNIAMNSPLLISSVSAPALLTNVQLMNESYTFSHYTGFYASMITLFSYKGAHTYYDPLNLTLKIADLKSKQLATWKLYADALDSYLFFANGMPGFQIYEIAKPSSISLNIGHSKPVNIAVDPKYQTYPLNNTKFVKNVNLRY